MTFESGIGRNLPVSAGRFDVREANAKQIPLISLMRVRFFRPFGLLSSPILRWLGQFPSKWAPRTRLGFQAANGAETTEPRQASARKEKGENAGLQREGALQESLSHERGGEFPPDGALERFSRTLRLPLMSLCDEIQTLMAITDLFEQ